MEQNNESFNDFCQYVEAMATRLNQPMYEVDLLMSLRKAIWQSRIFSVH